ncbi:MAG: sugar phosphate isomerase/epimerase [Ruminococcaceae bacterium]|nr:sugar phosphate isomerase/epimerase [Oscillospiraceae bacterium]
MKIGAMILVNENIDAEIAIKKDLGFDNCQLVCWDHSVMTDEIAQMVNDAQKKHNMEFTAFWCGWSGPCVWNFTEGPQTIGLVPKEYRRMRIEELKHGGDFAKKIGIKNVITHAGFIPENPADENYLGLVEAISEIAHYFKEIGCNFLFETGQETPTTLLRTIEAVGTDNLGINLDPANLIMYGKANPVDALDVIGKYVMGVHAKDGCYPTTGANLGRETRIGDGKVNFPVFLKKLHDVGYDGALSIEREIEGEQQIIDVMASVKDLNEIIGGFDA